MGAWGKELQVAVKMLFTVHRQVVFLLCLLPVLYTLFFGGLFYKNSLTMVPVVVCNLDVGDKGQELVRDLADTPELNVTLVNGDADTDKLLAATNAAGAIVIPQDYTAKISSGSCATVELLAAYGNTVEGGTITKAVQAVISAKNAELIAKYHLSAGWEMAQAQGAQLSLSTRTLYNPTGGYTDFFLSPLILHGGQIAMVFLLGPSLVLEKRYRGKEMLVYPIRVLLVKLLLYTLLGTAVMVLCLTIGIGFFHMVCRGSTGEIIMLLLAYMSCMVSFALLVGAWVKVPYRAITYSLFYIMPSVLFTGAIWPRSSMDVVSYGLSYLLPIGYVADDLRSLLVKGASAGLEVHIFILLLWGMFFSCMAVWGLKHALERKKNAGNYVAGVETAGS